MRDIAITNAYDESLALTNNASVVNIRGIRAPLNLILDLETCLLSGLKRRNIDTLNVMEKDLPLTYMKMKSKYELEVEDICDIGDFLLSGFFIGGSQEKSQN